MDMRTVVMALAPAAVACALGALIGWKAWSRTARPFAWAGVLLGVLFAAALAWSGWRTLGRWPEFPPRYGGEPAALYLVIAGGIAAIACGWRGGSELARGAVFVALGALAAWLTLGSYAGRNWDGAERWINLGVAGGVVAAAGWAMARGGDRVPGGWWPLAMWVWASAASATLVLGASAKLALFVAPVAAGYAACGVIALRRRDISSAGLAGPACAMAGCALMAGVVLSNVPIAAAGLLGAAPIAGLVSLAAPLKGWKRGLLLVLVVGVLSAAAAALAYSERPPSEPYM